MSKTRNQRARRKRLLYRLAFLAMALFFLLSLALAVYLWLQVERYQDENGERIRAPIYALDSFGIPEERMGDYEAACQRYIEENHLEIQPFRGDAGTVPGTIP